MQRGDYSDWTSQCKNDVNQRKRQRSVQSKLYLIRLAVDMKFRIYILVHIHRFYVDIHGYIHINTCLYFLYTLYSVHVLASCMGTRTCPHPTVLIVPVPIPMGTRTWSHPNRPHCSCPHPHSIPMGTRTCPHPNRPHCSCLHPHSIPTGLVPTMTRYTNLAIKQHIKNSSLSITRSHGSARVL